MDTNDPRLSGDSTITANLLWLSEQRMQFGAADVVLERPSGPDGGSLNAAIFPGEVPTVPEPPAE